MSQPVKPCTDPQCAICRADHIVDANKMVAAHSPDYSAVVRAAREAIEAFKLGCFVDAGNALRSLDAALSASPPPDAGTCRCVGTRRYTDGKCDKCGNRIVTEEPK